MGTCSVSNLGDGISVPKLSLRSAAIDGGDILMQGVNLSNNTAMVAVKQRWLRQEIQDWLDSRQFERDREWR